MLNLLRHIDTERFEPHLSMLEPQGMATEAIPGFVEVHDLGVRRARSAAVPIAKLCWKLKPNIVFSMSAHLNSAIVASQPLLPKRTALVVREGCDLTAPHWAPGPLRWLVYKHAYQRANLVICQSECMKQDLVRQFKLDARKVVRIYNPIDVEAITAQAAAEPNPFSGSGPNLVAVGRLSSEKGFDLLLKSLPLILTAVPKVTATVVGDGPDMPRLKAAGQKLGLGSVLRFVGPRRNPFPFLKHADLLVLPSRSEAMPNVVLEAIALGTTAVATNCTRALSEVLSCTRRLRVARDRTPEALADEVISALTRAPARCGSIEPQFEERFGVRAVIQQYEHAFLQSSSEQTVRAVNAVA